MYPVVGIPVGVHAGYSTPRTARPGHPSRVKAGMLAGRLPAVVRSVYVFRSIYDGMLAEKTFAYFRIQGRSDGLALRVGEC